LRLTRRCYLIIERTGRLTTMIVQLEQQLVASAQT
jgi:hypothetical protein